MNFIPNYLTEISMLDACIRGTVAFVVGIFVGMLILWDIEERIDHCGRYEKRVLESVNWVYEKFKFIF